MHESVPKIFIRKAELMEMIGLSSSAIDSRIDKGLLPPPVSMGGRAVGWISNEVVITTQAYIAEKTQEEIRNIVDNLIRNRQKATQH